MCIEKSCPESRHQLLAILFVAGFTLLFARATTAQTKFSDSEMKEVVRLLLEREVQRPADGGNVTVLLSPGVKPDWIPEVPGLSIRQLSYDEQTRVPDYYDLTASFKGSVIELMLTKGNYCRKAGPRYEFRRKAGAWQSRVTGFAKSTGVGGSCDGCVVGSGVTHSVDSPPRPGNLRLSGSVRKISCSKETDFIRCRADVNLTFTNTGSTSMIILQPQGEYEFWHGGTTLALTEKESLANAFVYNGGGWPSIYRSPLYQNLANLLDQSVPPAGLTSVLLPSGSWSWDTSITLGLQERNICNQRVGVEIGWDEIKRRTAPLWLRVSYEMWPFNVENFKPNLGGILQKRWQSHGLLYLEEKSARHWHAILTSDPIEFPLNTIDLAVP